MAVTLQQIVERTGVNVGSVSRILNGQGRAHRISQERIDAVLAASTELGYRPNAAAKAARSGKFHNIVLVQGVREFTSNLPNELLDALYTALDTNGYHLTFARLADPQLTDEGFVPRFLRSWMCDGLLINYHAGTPEKMVELVERHGLPSTWLNFKATHNCVYPDDFTAGKLAAEHLLERGHRRIVYADLSLTRSVQYGVRHYSKDDRLAGYGAAMAAAGLAPWIVQDDGTEVRYGLDGFTRDLAAALRLPPSRRATAVLGYSMAELVHVLPLLGQFGWTMGRDLSLMAVCGSRETLWREAVTAYLPPLAEVGARSVEMLMHKLAHPEEMLPAVAMPFTFFPGETVGPPPLDQNQT